MEWLSYIWKYKGTFSVIGAIPTIVMGTFYALTWLDTTYASVDDLSRVEKQQTSFEQKLENINKQNRIDQLKRDIFETGDKIYDLKRRIQMDGPNAREEDRRQLDRLERRLELYQQELNSLEHN